jgi:oligopeptide transport system substrate-binding protein
MDPSRPRATGFPRLRGALPFVILALVLVPAARLALAARLEPADFTFNNGTEIASLDPGTVTGVPEGHVLRAIFEGLYVKHPRTLEPLPGVATSHELSADGRTYTFHLRDDARWSNGDPVTAHDFEYSWERLLDPESAAEYAYQLWYVKGARDYTLLTESDPERRAEVWRDEVGIRAVDDRTLVVELESPTPYFIQLTTFYPLFPVNRRNIEEAEARWPETWRLEWLRPDNLVTNGPFRVAERRINDRIRLVKNEHYWDADSVALDTIDVLAVENYATMLNMYLTGEVGWIDRVSTNQVHRLMEREDFNPIPYLGSYFFRVNLTRPPFDDLRVRRALALTIDRRAICEKIMKAGQKPSWSLVPPGMVGYPLGNEMAHAPLADDLSDYDASLAADVAHAKQLLAEAGFGPGGKPFPTFEIHYNTSEAHRDIAEVVASDWKKHLGIDARLLNQEFKVYLDTQRQLGYDVSRSAWIGDYVDPNTFLDLFMTGNENNKTGYSNARYDDLVTRAAAELDPARRMQLLGEAEALLLEELPILPVYYYVTQSMFNPRIGGLYDNLLDEHFPKFWYWRSDEELAAKRARQPADWILAPAPGPPEGQYAKNHVPGQWD